MRKILASGWEAGTLEARPFLEDESDIIASIRRPRALGFHGCRLVVELFQSGRDRVLALVDSQEEKMIGRPKGASCGVRLGQNIVVTEFDSDRTVMDVLAEQGAVQSLLFVASQVFVTIADDGWCAAEFGCVAHDYSLGIDISGVKLPNVGLGLDLNVLVRHGRSVAVVGWVVVGKA